MGKSWRYHSWGWAGCVPWCAGGGWLCRAWLDALHKSLGHCHCVCSTNHCGSPRDFIIFLHCSIYTYSVTVNICNVQMQTHLWKSANAHYKENLLTLDFFLSVAKGMKWYAGKDTHRLHAITTTEKIKVFRAFTRIHKANTHVSIQSSLLRQWFLMVLHREKAGVIAFEIYSQIMKWVVLTFVEKRAQPILLSLPPNHLQLEVSSHCRIPWQARQKCR